MNKDIFPYNWVPRGSTMIKLKNTLIQLLESSGGSSGDSPDLTEINKKISELEQENKELKQRLDNIEMITGQIDVIEESE